MNFDDVACSGKIRLYRFYNMEHSKYGVPFALCDAHRTAQPIPTSCHIEKIAEDAVWPCIASNEALETREGIAIIE